MDTNINVQYSKMCINYASPEDTTSSFYDRDVALITAFQFNKLMQDLEYQFVKTTITKKVFIITKWSGIDRAKSLKVLLPMIFETVVLSKEKGENFSHKELLSVTYSQNEEIALKNHFKEELTWMKSRSRTVSCNEITLKKLSSE